MKLYQESIDLQETLFQLPIDIKLILPHQLQKFREKSHYSYLKSRLALLQRKLSEIDARHVEVVQLVRGGSLGLEMHRSVRAGKVFLEKLAQKNDKDALVRILRWYLLLIRNWENILEK